MRLEIGRLLSSVFVNWQEKRYSFIYCRVFQMHKFRGQVGVQNLYSTDDLICLQREVSDKLAKKYVTYNTLSLSFVFLLFYYRQSYEDRSYFPNAERTEMP